MLGLQCHGAQAAHPEQGWLGARAQPRPLAGHTRDKVIYKCAEPSRGRSCLVVWWCILGRMRHSEHASPGYIQDTSQAALQQAGSPRAQPRQTCFRFSFSPQHTQDTFARDVFKTHISAQECFQVYSGLKSWGICSIWGTVCCFKPHFHVYFGGKESITRLTKQL